MKAGDNVDAYVDGQLVDATILEVKKTLILRRDKYLVTFERNVWSTTGLHIYHTTAVEYVTKVYPKPVHETSQVKFCNTSCRASKCVRSRK